MRRYEEAIAAYREALTIDPDDSDTYLNIGLDYFLLGDFQTARSWCEAKPDNQFSSACLAIVYDRLGRNADADTKLANFTSATGDSFPYIVAGIYAMRGNTEKALEWLDRAMRIRDAGLEQLKVDPFLDSLRKEPRFQAIEREVKFPS